MQKIIVLNIRGLRLSCSRTSLAAIVGAASLAGLTSYAYAAGSIDNSAIASGSYGGNAVPSQPSTATVPLADPTLQLTVLKTGVLNDGGDGLDAGETITYTVQVTNNSNVTVTDVTPSEDNIQFGATAGAGTFGAFSPLNAATLAPGASTSFTIDYTPTAADIYRAAAVTDGVQNTVDVTASAPGGVPVNGTDTSQNTIPADAGPQRRQDRSTGRWQRQQPRGYRGGHQLRVCRHQQRQRADRRCGHQRYARGNAHRRRPDPRSSDDAGGRTAGNICGYLADSRSGWNVGSPRTWSSGHVPVCPYRHAVRVRGSVGL